MRRFVREERGSALTIFAVALPVCILFLALAFDVGNWFTHKRQLQNRADAAALAAGVEYARNNLANLVACKAGDPGGTASTAITNAAKNYAGDPNPLVPGTKRNTEIGNQGSLTVVVNASSFGGADGSDGGGPCFDHAANASDFVSPKGGYWTDVKVKESNIPTFFGTFGINVPAISARARVEVRAVGSLNPHGPSIPFVGQSGDFVECAWAQFVNANTGVALPASQVGGQNPVPLPPVTGQPRAWQAALPAISAPSSSTNDIAVLAILGLPQTAGNCNTPPTGSSATLPDGGDGDLVGGVDWINVYQPHHPVGIRDEPAMNGASTAPSTCGTVGYVYRGSIPPTSCSITVNGTFDVGDQPGATGSATVYVNDSKTGASLLMSPVAAIGAVDGDWMWSGSVTLDPTAVNGGAGLTQNFTQVGQHRFSFCWVKTSGSLNNQPGGASCGGLSGTGKKNNTTGQWDCGTGGANPVCTDNMTFSTDNGATNSGSGGVHQATYLYDPIYSDPLTKLELLDNTGAPITNNSIVAGGTINAPTIRVEELGLDTYRTTVMHDSVQGSGNRTGAAECGVGGGAGVRDAIENGCQDPVQINWRGTGTTLSYSCAGGDVPASNAYITGHTPVSIDGAIARDCVGDPTGNKTGPIRQGMNNLFDCATQPNHWDPTKTADQQTNIQLSDPRIRDVFMAPFGVLEDGDHYPIVTFAAFYVTGWDGSPNSCDSTNEDPPRDYTGKGTSVWGHYMEYVDLTTGTNPSNDPCDLGQSVILCKPTLVR